MKKVYYFLIAGVVMVILLAAFVPTGEEDMPAADGEEFWTYISETDPYQQWMPWPGKEDMYPGQSPHGAYLKLFVNDKAYDAIKEGTQTMPDGAIVIKENYGKDQETLMAITPMYKMEGYNPDGGNWFWAKYGPDGEIMASGKVQGCIDCHKSKKEMDWLFTEIK